MSEQNNNQQKSESRSALQRLLIVLAILIGALIYSYGWTVVEIDLARPQEELRQDNVTRALRELLSPRIFEQERELQTYEASILMDCEAGDAPVQAEVSGTEPMVVIEPACAASGDTITVHFYNSIAGADARIRWQPPSDDGGEVANERPLEIIETEREDIVLSQGGTFTGTVEVPRIRGGEGQIHTVRVLVAVPNGPILLSETANLVIEKMIQTIFMALVATTVAIPIAAFISFFAARNLMRRVKLSVGSMLLTFIMLVAGFWIGSNYVVPLAKLGLSVGKGEMLGSLGVLAAFIVPIVVVVAAVFLLRELAKILPQENKRDAQANALPQVLNTIISSVVLIFIVGAIAGLCILIGNGITGLADGFRPANVESAAAWSQNAFANLIWSVGNDLIIIGSLVELLIVGVVGIISGFALSGIIGSLFGNTVRRIEGVPSNILGAIFGAISGAILMAMMAAFGLWAALLGVMPLLIGGLLGGFVAIQLAPLLAKIYPRQLVPIQLEQVGLLLVSLITFVLVFKYTPVAIIPRPFNLLVDLLETTGSSEIADFLMRVIMAILVSGLVYGVLSRLVRTGKTIVFAIGFVLVAAYLFNQLGLGRSLVDGTLPPQDTVFGLPITTYTFNAALTGAVLGAISGFLSGVHGTFPLGDMFYYGSRTTLNLVRSVEPLIMGLVFVVWVGIGPFAGVLALTLHSIAALGKLYSEQIENIDPGPIEALQSTGANQLQTIIYAVVPQIVPPYIAFTMYRWDINVRMSTIIGFVGGGGIGLLLQQQINLLRYRDAGVAVLAIAIVVSILDYVSAYIRERIT